MKGGEENVFKISIYCQRKKLLVRTSVGFEETAIVSDMWRRRLLYQHRP